MSTAPARFTYERREPKPSTPTSPTMAALLGERDHSKWERVTVPLITRAYNIGHQDITLNKRTYKPGESYTLPPVIAAELRNSIENFEEKIILQFTKNGQGMRAGMQAFSLEDGRAPTVALDARGAMPPNPAEIRFAFDANEEP